MEPWYEHQRAITRRALFGQVAGGLGAAALATLLGDDLTAAPQTGSAEGRGRLAKMPHVTPHAKRVIYLFQSGGPAHMDLFDYKPELRQIDGTELPESIRKGQRLTTMTSGQKSFPCVAPRFQFTRHGQAGAWFSEAVPHMSSIADDICLVKSLHTEAINHDPAITYINTGSQQLGKPSMGSWLSYGIGTENRDLPAYVVLTSKGTALPGQPLFSRLWGSGFLPSNHQGVRFRSGQDPVLYLSNPPGLDAASQRRMLDRLSQLNDLQARQNADPEIKTRIAQYEMAYRMQASVPELMDLSDESAHTLELYGPDSSKPGTFAANCLLARRMAERGVRFIQLFHRGWDQHGNLPSGLRKQARNVDQPSTALVRDLKVRGMLDETLVVWGGEFGRTIYNQGKLTKDNYGRDHHGRCFTTWLAGGGIRGGMDYGKTDEYSYNIVQNPVHINDLNATILDRLGIDHRKLTYRFQGLEQRLTGVEEAHVVGDILM